MAVYWWFIFIVSYLLKIGVLRTNLRSHIAGAVHLPRGFQGLPTKQSAK